jgi:CRISPR-associated endonuclease/helicase Cas3
LTRPPQGLSDLATSVWAKSSKLEGEWLPLWRHLDDAAGVAGLLWDRWLPDATKHLITGALPGGEADGRRLAVWLAGVHDIGKATPAFAIQLRSLAAPMRERGLGMPFDIPYGDRVLARHAVAGQILLEQWLTSTHRWSPRQTRQYAIVVGGHHGVPPSAAEIRQATERPHLLGLGSDQRSWQVVHQELLDRAAECYHVTGRLPHWQGLKLSQPVQVLLTGLVIVADWIASDEHLFPYDPERLHLPSRLADAWDERDLPTPWHAVTSMDPPERLFTARFTLPPAARPHPVQIAAVELARAMPTPGLLIIEAPMGEGKTEAALAAAEQLAARCGAGGCFVALPTRATSDAMFTRVRDWLARVPDAAQHTGALALTLAHGKARFNDDFTALMWHGYATSVEPDAPERSGDRAGKATGRDVAAHRWLTGRKKAMLSSSVVGTIDQLLFAALKSRHLALRHLGLAGKIVIIDEAHAYDVYMSHYLDRALEWLAAYRVPTIVLSATLPARRRRMLLEAYDRGRGIGRAPARRPSWRDDPAAAPAPDPYAALDGDPGYPLLAASGTGGQPTVRIVAPSGREVAVAVERVDDDLDTLASLLRTALAGGGCALVIRNTVRRVQETAAHLRQALAGSSVDVTVAHSRFLAPDRAARDEWLRTSFGPPEHLRDASCTRPDRHVVVASQVAEQSLDIDFDLLVTDLAPADLVLQRAGRLHRHQRGTGQSHRPEPLRRARCLVTGVDWSTSPPTPVAGSQRVYGQHPLLRSLAVLHPHLDGDRALRLPADIAPIVQAAYGDTAIGPAPWQEAMTAAQQRHVTDQQQKEHKAETFRLAQWGPAGQPVIGWLDGGVGDVDDDPRLEGRRQVRDTAAESVEVMVLVRRTDGTLVTPPWLRRDGGRQIPTDHEPDPDLARTIATCTLALPIQLCRIETIEELEQQNHFPAWERSLWLAGELLLVLDEHGDATVDGHRLHYDRDDGLTVTRLEA